MRYTLRQLEVFLAVAHFENVTKAAESLAMSQSAASGALKDFEQQFDLQWAFAYRRAMQRGDEWNAWLGNGNSPR